MDKEFHNTLIDISMSIEPQEINEKVERLIKLNVETCQEYFNKKNLLIWKLLGIFLSLR